MEERKEEGEGGLCGVGPNDKGRRTCVQRMVEVMFTPV